MYAFIIAYALFMNPPLQVDIFNGLTRWSNTNVFYKYDSRLGCIVFTVYIYNKHRNKIREVGVINVIKYPGDIDDMVTSILDDEERRMRTNIFYDPWAWRIL